MVNSTYERPCLCALQILVGTVFVLSAVMMAGKFYIDRSVQPEDVRSFADFLKHLSVFVASIHRTMSRRGMRSATASLATGTGTVGKAVSRAERAHRALRAPCCLVFQFIHVTSAPCSRAEA
jgi:hypothetical protein